jgi:hypothetical protein
MLTAAVVTCSPSAAALKLRSAATASNTRAAFNGSRAERIAGPPRWAFWFMSPLQNN